MNTQRTYMQLGAAALFLALWTPFAGADMFTFYPTDDAMIRMYSPDGNYGSGDQMQVVNAYGAGGWKHYENDTLVRFDVSSIPVGTPITSAVLHLYFYRWHDNNPAGRPLTCYRLTSNWEETSVTWDTQPTRVLEPSCVAAVPPSYDWMSWDLTDDVQAFVNDPGVNNYGWMILDETYWGHYNIPVTHFRSKEYGAFVPYLTVVPEPGTLSLFGLGGATLIRRRRSSI